MITLKQVNLLRGNKMLLDKASATLFNGQKIGLVGANGAGKSSLFALLQNELQVDSGEVDIPSRLTIAHVAQETPALSISALEYALDGDRELRAIEAAIAEETDGFKQAELYGKLEEVGGYTANNRASKLLSGLGFSNQEMAQSVASFSGGWRMRLNLAQALMCRSDLLLLDEPTNHLDLETVIWLEAFLRSYEGTLILISHDRDFLDSTVSHILHLANGILTLYSGNYSAYEIQKEARMQEQQATYDKQQLQIAHLNSYIERFRAQATKARQAQSRIKTLERMDKIAALHVHSPFQFTFLTPLNSPNPLLRLDEASVAYPGQTRPTLDELDFSIEHGARIGLLGPNGAGKSTLIKLMANSLSLSTGQRIEGKGLKIGYFAQHQLEALRMEYSPIWHMQQLDPYTREQEHRNFLGGFNFRGEMATGSVENFSGGEKARLSLALLIWQKPNLLLLDEPTNHLDLEMRDALTLALQEYEGALLVVSHDRHFLRAITDSFWLIDKGNVQPFEGDLDDYKRYVESEKSQEKLALSQSSQAQAQKVSEQKPSTSQQKSIAQKLEKAEAKMSDLLDKVETLEKKLADNKLYVDENQVTLHTLLAEAEQARSALQQAEEQWLALQAQWDEIAS
jgi:ATP-binding cassette subfamily F protein 3